MEGSGERLRDVDVDEPSRWEADAEVYDSWFDRPWGSYASRIEYEMLADAIGPIDGVDLCDAGCGTGRFAARFEDDGAAVVGVDTDIGSLTVARRRISGPLVGADVHRLPFAAATFDVTVAITVCEFVTSPADVVAELVRVTRPGGRVVIAGLELRSPWGWWNRRQFAEPPWDTARFLQRSELDRITSAHGETVWNTGLHAPTALPGMRYCGPVVERLGQRLTPRTGAFWVVTVTLPPAARS